MKGFSVFALALALALGSASAFTGLHRQRPTALSPGFKSAFKTKLTSVAPALKVRMEARARYRRLAATRAAGAPLAGARIGARITR